MEAIFLVMRPFFYKTVKFIATELKGKINQTAKNQLLPQLVHTSCYQSVQYY